MQIEGGVADTESIEPGVVECMEVEEEEHVNGDVILRWPNIVFKSLCLILHIQLLNFFARVKINYRSIYSRILTRVHAVAMATGLVKNKA